MSRTPRNAAVNYLWAAYLADTQFFSDLQVFHVCALTDDGLIMKSFLCPESTLFDQTVLKCNWWFYVDCKASRRLYDSNIPVSKSYQLMKALAFFSSYKKTQEDGEPQAPRGRALQQQRLLPTRRHSPRPRGRGPRPRDHRFDDSVKSDANTCRSHRR
ncbi:uncharacterized protein LOC113212334 isoform X1 [Frankliniella occidentalis]|uniref:Uncharacterized protein LOC113212334 isoform X1 n=1 Tax=Frankliniella occidentalis TaxID=133901 RepID=A0A6J1T164_FRAOC|nr:uncharacterized protein LOC113212334 isoform X1 [Frankliniella occidentalis]